MSHEGGPESTQKRTVAELLAMYGDETGERAPRRRRRRPDDVTDTNPHAIAERINSESAKLAPIRDDQPPPVRTSHRQQRSGHHPVPPMEPPRAAAPPPQAPPRPAPRRQQPSQQLPQPSQQLPQPSQQLPQPSQQLPLPPNHQQGPPPTTVIPAITAHTETRPVAPQPPQQQPQQPPPQQQQPLRRVRRAAPPQQAMPSGTFPAPDAGPYGSGYFQQQIPLPQPLPPPQELAPKPEAATEQLPKIPPGPQQRTGTFPPARPGFGTAMLPSPPAQEQRNGVLAPPARDGYGEPALDERPLPGYQDEDELDGDEYADDYPDDDLDDEEPSPGREWLIMAGQVALSVLGGAAVWLGFNWLWGKLPQAALVAALAVIVGLVWIVRKIRRADDLQTTGLAVLVGLFVTVSPAALLLLSK